MAVALSHVPMLCLRCGFEDDNALGSCPQCDSVDGTASLKPATSVPLARVPLVRMRAAEVFAEAVAMLGDREMRDDESGVTARLASADDEIPTIAAPEELPLETARGAALEEPAGIAEPPVEESIVEEVAPPLRPAPEPIPEREEPLFAPERIAPAPRRRAKSQRRPRGGLLMMIASCIGMTFAGTAIGSMQFGPDMPAPSAVATARAAATPADAVPVEVAQVVESLPPVARPAPAMRVAKKSAPMLRAVARTSAIAAKKAPAKAKKIKARR